MRVTNHCRPRSRAASAGALLASVLAALPAFAQTAPAPAHTQPASSGSVRPQPRPAPPPPPNFVTLRSGIISFAADGTPMSPIPGGSSPVWLWDLFGVGMAIGQLDLMFHMSTQNIAAGRGEFSTLYARGSAGWRPLRTGRLRFADPYVFGGVGLGWAGKMVLRDKSCNAADPTVACEYDRSGIGGGPHAGVGIDFNFPLTTFATGQQLLAFVGLETRAELFFHQGPQLYWVYTLPIGLRLQ